MICFSQLSNAFLFSGVSDGAGLYAALKLDKCFTLRCYELQSTTEIEPGTAGWEARWLPLSSTAPPDVPEVDQLLFYYRLDFCDDTVDKVHSTIGDALAFAIREGFFEKVLEDDLYENAEQVSKLSCLPFSNCWNRTFDPSLMVTRDPGPWSQDVFICCCFTAVTLFSLSALFKIFEVVLLFTTLNGLSILITDRLMPSITSRSSNYP